MLSNTAQRQQEIDFQADEEKMLRGSRLDLMLFWVIFNLDLSQNMALSISILTG